MQEENNYVNIDNICKNLFLLNINNYDYNFLVKKIQNIYRNYIKNKKEKSVKKIQNIFLKRKLEKEKLEEIRFLNMVKETIKIYFKFGCRSSKKVDFIHEYIKKELEKILKSNYCVKLEQNIKSLNSTGKKKCDIVLYKNNIPYIIFPVKCIMTSYYKNANNYYENLTGEVQHLKLSSLKNNTELFIIPINIIFNKIPNLYDSPKKIKNIENITYEKSLKIYENLKYSKILYNDLQSSYICWDIINYIINIEHTCEINEIYNKPPNIIGFNEKTSYKTFSKILSKLIN